MKPFTLIFLCFFSLLSSLCLAQADSVLSCGTLMIDPAQKESHQRWNEQFYQALATKKNVLSEHKTVFIPVQFFVIRKDDGSGDFPDQDLDIILERTNEHFRAGRVQFFQCAPAIRIDSLRYRSLDEVLIKELGQLYFRDSVINIFLPASSSVYGSATNGFAEYPNPPKPAYAVVNQYSARHGLTLEHELGHTLFLYHTHHGDESVARTNCYQEGDLLCDTDADPNLNGKVLSLGCEYNGGEEDRYGEPYKPPVLNIMSYTNRHCRCQFTSEQFARIHWALENIIQNLACRKGALEANFYAVKKSICGSALRFDFYNTSLGNPDSLHWNFGVAGGFSSAPSPSYTYPDTGLFEVRMTAWKGAEQQTVKKWIRAGAFSPPYFNGFESEQSLSHFYVEKSTANAFITDQQSYSGDHSLALHQSYTDAYTDILETPESLAFDPYYNPRARTRLSLCIDAASSEKLLLEFDFKSLQGPHDYWGSNFRILINGEDLTGTLRTVSTTANDEKFTHHKIDISTYSGMEFVLELEASHQDQYSGGNRGTASFIDNLQLSDSFEMESQLVVYPNPTSGNLTFNATPSELGLIRIYNSGGKLVMKAPKLESHGYRSVLNIANLPPGIYICKCDIQTFRVSKL